MQAGHSLVPGGLGDAMLWAPVAGGVGSPRLTCSSKYSSTLHPRAQLAPLKYMMSCCSSSCSACQLSPNDE
jgi:hypothetical protein